MHTVDWIKLLNRVPAEQVDNLSLITVLGLEIAVQSIVQLEEQYAVVRGRMSGTNDGDKAFFVPYDQLCFLGFQRSVSEAVLQHIVSGTPLPPPAPKAEQAEVEETAPVAPEPAPPAAPPAPVAAAPRNQTPTKSPNMAALLDRIRSRSQQPHPERASSGS